MRDQLKRLFNTVLAMTPTWIRYTDSAGKVHNIEFCDLLIDSCFSGVASLDIAQEDISNVINQLEDLPRSYRGQVWHNVIDELEKLKLERTNQ